MLIFKTDVYLFEGAIIIAHERLPGVYDFNTEFDTYILAYCPDTCSWFATNKRFFYFEYPKEFGSEEEALEFIRNHAHIFLDFEESLGIYRPDFAADKIFIDNTKECVDILAF